MNLICEGNKKHLIYLIILYVTLPFIILSCGILNSQSDNHPTVYSVKKKIYTISADGTNIKFLAYGGDPKFSRDGSKIYFNNGGLCSINIDGTGRNSFYPEICHYGIIRFRTTEAKLSQVHSPIYT